VLHTFPNSRHARRKGVDVVLASELDRRKAHSAEALLDLIDLKQCDSRLGDARVGHGEFASGLPITRTTIALRATLPVKAVGAQPSISATPTVVRPPAPAFPFLLLRSSSISC